MTKWFVLFWVLAASSLCLAQSESATLSGRVSDPSGAPIVGAEVVLTNTETSVEQRTKTNEVGLYVFAGVHPGAYRVAAGAPSFKVLIKEGLTLHVQDELAENFSLTIGAISESVTVTADATPVNTTDGTVGTVVDRKFVENMPLNGRSFQTLIQLTPGVVSTVSSTYDSGQFSVNGQRASSNYWTVDGVSANIGISPFASPGNGFGGTLGSFSALGGTNSLVSVDALQEFRIQTSTFAPEFGRTPGGQIAIITRSGTNQFHGTAFDYFRNDVLDANNWFNGYTNNPPLPKAEERQNDFGGVVSGPIIRDKTFFFFSYEGLRLRLPQTALTTVPDMASRESASPLLQPYLNAYPSPNGADLGNGVAEFNASYSNSATLDAYSIRMDHHVNDKLTLFGRYNYSPSSSAQRGGEEGNSSLSVVFPSKITTLTATIGGTWSMSPNLVDEMRFNFSRTAGDSYAYLDHFGQAVPLPALPFPSPYTAQNASFSLNILSLLSGGQLIAGQNARNTQHQLNIVDTLAVQRGSHSLKFGIDFRRLSPSDDPISYDQQVYFLDVPSAETGNLFITAIGSARSATFLFRSLGVFAQDTWRISPRLTMTSGLRWDIDSAPSSLDGPGLLAVTGFNLNDLSKLALAPAGTPPFKTTYGNIAPRIGAAYQVSQSPNWGTVFRGGFGVFYDLASSETGSLISIASYPFGALGENFGGTFPQGPAAAAPPAITLAYLSSPFGTLGAFDPHLRLPYALEWNVAAQQSLGTQQTVTASYVGSIGRRLIQSAYVVAPNASFGNAYLVGNMAESNYNALQLQFNRRLSADFQALASYTWSHSIDTASAGSVFGNEANAAAPGLDPSANRGPSDFDIRHSLSAGLTYDIPALKRNSFANTFLGGWSVNNFVIAHTAPPVTVSDVTFSTLFNGYTSVRPDIVPGMPLYVYGSECIAVFASACPGGKGFNPVAFTNPPVDPVTGLPLRQGSLARNALRGFGAWQWDFAVHRDFPIYESLRMQFRAEMFNVLNHPNFGPPNAGFGSGGFGVSNQMLGQSLAGNSVGGGGFSPLYQLGGPRSIQLALKLIF